MIIKNPTKKLKQLFEINDIRYDVMNQKYIDNENELQNLINELNFTNPLSGLEYLSIDEMEKNDNDNDLLNEEVIISMLNFNEENQDEKDIEQTPISSQFALLAIEKVNLFVEQQFKEFTNEELKLLKNVKKKIKKIEFNSTKQSKLDRFFNINIE